MPIPSLRGAFRIGSAGDPRPRLRQGKNSGFRDLRRSPASCRRRKRRADTTPHPRPLFRSVEAGRPRALVLLHEVRARRPRGELDHPLQDVRQEPAQPDAFPFSAGSDPVHPVVPVARSHLRQTVRAKDPTAVRRPGGSVRTAWPARGSSPAGRNSPSGFSPIPGRRGMGISDWRMPSSPVTRTYCAAANGSHSKSSEIRVRTPLPPGGCHQCWTSPSLNWRPAARRMCSRVSSGWVYRMGKAILQLIAESIRAAGLIKSGASPDAAA